jgi:hypothetical protein
MTTKVNILVFVESDFCYIDANSILIAPQDFKSEVFGTYLIVKNMDYSRDITS